MKILIGTHHLKNYEGTETYSYTLVKQLKDRGHQLVVYSPYLGAMSDKMKSLGLQVVSNLRVIKKEKFDIIHAQHNIIALAIRIFFPDIPLVLNIHSVISELETPPIINIGISKYIVVSEEVQAKLLRHKNIQLNKIEVVRNFIDLNRFYPRSAINDRLKNLLVVSNRMPEEEIAIIKKCCGLLKIKFNIIGISGQAVWRVENFINQADLIISLGRGALEAMACGRAVIIYDYLGADGLLTKDNYLEIRKNNFSGRRYGLNYNQDDLIKELRLYRPALGRDNLEIARREHDAAKNTEQLLSIYRQVIKEYKNSRPRKSGLFSLLPPGLRMILPDAQNLYNKFIKKLKLI